MKKYQLVLDFQEKKRLNAMARQLQGFLMEHLEASYVQDLHQRAVNPYSMSLYPSDGVLIWEVNLLDESAIHYIEPFIETVAQIELHGMEEVISVIDRPVSVLDQKALAQAFYHEEAETYHRLSFLSPTSFKQAGSYINYPDLRLLLQSLMMKINFFETGEFEGHEELLNDLVNALTIERYSLRSSTFSIHQYRIPSFKGCLVLKVRGSDTLKNYLRYLLMIGEYTGVGVKTSMGMGALAYLREVKE